MILLVTTTKTDKSIWLFDKSILIFLRVFLLFITGTFSLDTFGETTFWINSICLTVCWEELMVYLCIILNKKQYQNLFFLMRHILWQRHQYYFEMGHESRPLFEQFLSYFFADFLLLDSISTTFESWIFCYLSGCHRGQAKGNGMPWATSIANNN